MTEKEYANLCIRLADAYTAKKITEPEYLREWAYLILLEPCFSVMLPKPIPTPPKEMDGYSMLSADSKINIGKDATVRAYFYSKTEAENHNKTMLLRLKEAKSLIPEDDLTAHAKLNERIAEFEGTNFNFRHYQAA